MRELNGVWWTLNQEKIPGKLVITESNKIYLKTYSKLKDTNIICGFADGEKITLVDTYLDRTDIYTDTINKNEFKMNKKGEDLNLQYTTYQYNADIAIFGHIYERKGDIRLKNIQLYYTNLDEWIDYKVLMPEIENKNDSYLLKIKKFNENSVKTEKFDLRIEHPYKILKNEYDVKISSQIKICIEKVVNEYIHTIQGIVQNIQFFLVLCTGDNVNIESIEATDLFDRNIQIILGYGKSNYENRSIMKNIIKYKDIEKNFDEIFKNWIKVYESNELLIINFVKLQCEEDLLISEYMNLVSAIESLHLLVIQKEQTKDSFFDIVKKLLIETNFILNFSEKEIEELSKKIKNIRRYFVHSNKTQKNIVHNNISIIKSIISILIECIRVRIMLEIGVEQSVIEKFYSKIENLKEIKYNIINNINEDEIIESDGGENVMNSLSKKEKEYIGELNALLGTRYRENEYDLNNTEDLIEIIENTTAEYMDYSNYFGSLSTILENFDQSLEVFHPEKWFRMTKEESTGDDLIDSTLFSMEETIDNMYELVLDAEKRCRELWEFLLLGKDEEAQKYFLGNIKRFSKAKKLDALEGVLENVFDIKYEN